MNGAEAHDHLAELSLEELLTLEVTSVAKKPQAPGEAPAAITVITQEDLRRAGVTTLPEALRLAPGVEVAAIDGTITAVSLRGFNWRFSNKLLVLIDGRAIYQPSVGGILWDQQHVPVEDIQRIEVVRGPGATMWGANAVNGVINVVTKHAADTLNGLVTGQTDFDDRKRVFGRYGWQIGSIGAGRAYGTAQQLPALVDSDGQSFNDGGEFSQFGFRVDLEPTSIDSITLQGDAQFGSVETTIKSGLLAPGITQGIASSDNDQFNLLGRWVRTWSPYNALSVQGYVDTLSREEYGIDFEVLNFDLDVSHRFKPTAYADIVWGFNLRRLEDESSAESEIRLTPADQVSDWKSVFAQTEFAFLDDKLRTTLGAKLEQYDSDDVELQPSLRFIYLENSSWSYWGAVSRAVRTPSRIENSLLSMSPTIAPFSERNPLPLPLTIISRGDPETEVETLVAYEAGFRGSFSQNVTFDVSTYLHDYDGLLTNKNLDPQFTFAPVGPGGALLPIAVTQEVILTNGDQGGQIRGIEVELESDITDSWSVTALFDARDFDLPEQQGFAALNDSPEWQASLRSDFEVTPEVDASIWVRHVSDLKFGQGDAYTDLDIRATWRVNERLSLSILGENLLDNQRNEIDPGLYPTPSGDVERRILVKSGLRF